MRVCGPCGWRIVVLSSSFFEFVLRRSVCRDQVGVAARDSAAPTALGISLPPYPSPSGLGSRLDAGPPGLDGLLGRTCHSSEINRNPHVVASMQLSRKDLIWTRLIFSRPYWTGSQIC